MGREQSAVRLTGYRAHEGASKDGRDGLHLSEIGCDRLQPNTGTGKLHLGAITLLDSGGCDTILDDGLGK